MAKKMTRGRKRVGAGRKASSPEGSVITIAVSVPSGLVEQLDVRTDQEGWSRSGAVTHAIRGLLAKRKSIAKN
jgi:metal-responsive CopG/Arc/MetJ family transcriptional regulator